MPKILVVFYSGDDACGAIADAVAAGAESVRFSEVDVRALGVGAAHVSASKPRRQIASAEELALYDAIVIGGPSTASGVPAELAGLMRELATSEARAGFADKVGSAFTTSTVAEGELPAAPIVASLASLGMILIPSVGSAGNDTLVDRARAMGRRVAQVTAWVAHSLGHERDHAHQHHAPHSHAHGHTHASSGAHGHGHEHPHSHDDERSHGGEHSPGHGHSHGSRHEH